MRPNYISIHVPLRGGRPRKRCVQQQAAKISIHVPLRGGRLLRAILLFWILAISIHVPLRGGRPVAGLMTAYAPLFQSTSPYAGDDCIWLEIPSRYQNFNPRPPTRGTTNTPVSPISQRKISIHVPPTRGTTANWRLMCYDNIHSISYAVDLFAGKPVKAVYGYLIVFNRCRLRDSFL